MNVPHQIFVSVIVPIYNIERYIEEAIQSILSQTLENIEVILVNDGSNDNSEIICQQYAAAHSNITYLYQSNGGVSVARNNGFLRAKGDYVFFMDADDTIEPGFLTSCYQVAIDSGADIVIVGADFVHAHPYTAALPTCAQFLKRSFLNEYPDIRFPEGIQPCEDGLLSHRLLAVTKKVTVHPEAQYFYRQHDSQNHIRINEHSWAVLKQIPKWFEILTAFYDKYDLWDSHVEHLLLFLEHEPFNIRYFELPLDEEQKTYLFNLIHDFEKKHRILGKCDSKKLPITTPFRFFLKAKNSREFDDFYNRFKKRRAIKRKILLFLSKLIPVAGKRREFRTKIRKTYQR